MEKEGSIYRCAGREFQNKNLDFDIGSNYAHSVPPVNMLNLNRAGWDHNQLTTVHPIR